MTDAFKQAIYYVYSKHDGIYYKHIAEILYIADINRLQMLGSMITCDTTKKYKMDANDVLSIVYSIDEGYVNVESERFGALSDYDKKCLDDAIDQFDLIQSGDCKPYPHSIKLTL